MQITDLVLLDVGMVTDLFTEKANDSAEWDVKATQEDIKAFFG